MRQRISDALRQTVILQAKFLCEYCLVHEDDFYLSGEVDHISAVKHGGINELSNLAYACIHCNRNKGTDEAIVVNGQAVRFFNLVLIFGATTSNCQAQSFCPKLILAL